MDNPDLMLGLRTWLGRQGCRWVVFVRGPKARLTVSVCITPELMVMIKVEIHYLHLASIYYTDSLIY